MAMIQSLRLNRDQLKNRRRPFNKDRLEGMPSRYHKAIRMKRATKVQLEKIRRQMKTERKMERIKIFLALIMSIGICIALAFLILRLATN